MCENACELRLRLRSLDASQVQEHRTTGQCKRIDIGLVHHVELVRPVISGCVLDEVPAQSLNVLTDRIRVRQNGHSF